MTIRSSVFVLLLTLCVAIGGGCENQGGPGSVMPGAMSGPNGQIVSVVGLSDGAVVTCQPAGGDTWAFSARFVASQLDAKYVAQMLVEIDKDTSGQDVWKGNRGPYVQVGSMAVGPGTATGVLAGRIGPPVSTKVRFNVAIRLVNASGATLAVSEAVNGLKPRLQ